MHGRGDVTGYKGQCLVEGWGKAGLAVMVDHLDWIVDIPQEECVSKGQHGKKGGGGSLRVCLFFFGLLSVLVFACGQFYIVTWYFLHSGSLKCEILQR